MRTSRLADSLFPKTRQSILAAIFMNPGRPWYVRDLARHLGVSPSSLQYELARLTAAGILKRWLDGQRVCFQADKECPVYSELRSLIIKTVGIVDVLRDALKAFDGKIDVAFVYGSIAQGEEKTASDIDLMIIGSVTVFELVPVLDALTEKLLREVNPVVYTPKEFAKKAAESRFVQSVLGRPSLFVIGPKDDLEGIIGGGTRRKGRH
jgi:predicted nucleotidyltransferase